jgi:hypothetical protein
MSGTEQFLPGLQSSALPSPASGSLPENRQVAMKPATEVSPFKHITSIDFFRRAQHYRLAAAITDNQRDVQMFCELAMMFDEIACAFQHIEAKRRHSAAMRRGSNRMDTSQCSK